jgi:uncharacterized protein (TIGR03085 family)
MNWARHERSELADLLVAVGPDAPTLCEGWSTRDLAAHLVLRERRPDAAAGILIKPLAGYTAKVQDELAQHSWDELVGLVRTGPPGWTPAAWDPVDKAINTVEFFVHHEDVRRAAPDWEPRPVDVDLEDELWGRLRFGSRIMARQSPVGVVLRRSGDGEVRAKSGDPEVTITGPASELVLFASGRQSHARVDIAAPDDVAARIRTARLGI